MRFSFTSGSLFNGLAIIGSGALGYWPDQKWIGLLIMCIGVFALIFDLHFERGQLELGTPQSLGTRLKRMWPQLLMGISVVGFVIGLVAFLRSTTDRGPQAQGIGYISSLPPANTTRNQPNLDAKILIQCLVGTSPNVPSSQRANVLPLASLNVKNETQDVVGSPANAYFSLTEYFTRATPGAPWQFEQDPLAQIYRCEITNYDTEPLFSVRIPFRLRFHHVKLTGGNQQSGDVFLDVIYPIQVARLDTGPDRPFVFYVWGMMPDEFVYVDVPSKVSAQRLGTNARKELSVIDSSTKNFWVNPTRPVKPSPSVNVGNAVGSIIAPSGGTNSVTNNFGPVQRTLKENQIKILRQGIPPNSIIEIMKVGDPEADKFADEIAKAIRRDDVTVTIGDNNTFVPVPQGLQVRFNHHDDTAASIFEALKKAHLEPIDEGELSGTATIFIKVGSP